MRTSVIIEKKRNEIYITKSKETSTVLGLSHNITTKQEPKWTDDS